MNLINMCLPLNCNNWEYIKKMKNQKELTPNLWHQFFSYIDYLLSFLQYYLYQTGGLNFIFP